MDTGLGGIATYVQQASHAMVALGHTVEVFAGSPRREGTFDLEGFPVHLVRKTEAYDFACAVAPVFARRHAEIKFDVLEGAEFNADAAEVAKLVADIPLVVKTHMPTLLLARLNHRGGWRQRLKEMLSRCRMIAGALRRGRPPPAFTLCPMALQRASERDRIEADHARQADIVVSPCRDLCQYVAKSWGIPAERIRLVPNPFNPPRELLAVPIETRRKVVGFFGRIEVRKGVLDLAKAIPSVLAACPHARFKFVGDPQMLPGSSHLLSDHIRREVGGSRDAVEFTGKVALQGIPEQMASVDVAVFPSIWENFPYVCLEAMAAGRGIVASSAGGMAEMLDGGKTGLLVPPRCPDHLAKALIFMLEQHDQRWLYGTLARRRVLDVYGGGQIGALMERTYEEAIRYHRAAGPRRQHLNTIGPNIGRASKARIES